MPQLTTDVPDLLRQTATELRTSAKTTPHRAPMIHSQLSCHRCRCELLADECDDAATEMEREQRAGAVA